MNNYLSVIWWAIIWIAIGAYYLRKQRIDTHEWTPKRDKPYEPSYLRPRRIKAICNADKDDILRHRTLLWDYKPVTSSGALFNNETDKEKHQRPLADYFK